MRVLAGVLVFIYFIGRMIYKGLITRDLSQNKDELYIGLGFSAMWVFIYTLMYFG